MRQLRRPGGVGLREQQHSERRFEVRKEHLKRALVRVPVRKVRAAQQVQPRRPWKPASRTRVSAVQAVVRAGSIPAFAAFRLARRCAASAEKRGT